MTAPCGESTRYTADELRIILEAVSTLSWGKQATEAQRLIKKTKAALAAEEGR